MHKTIPSPQRLPQISTSHLSLNFNPLCKQNDCAVTVPKIHQSFVHKWLSSSKKAQRRINFIVNRCCIFHFSLKVMLYDARYLRTFSSNLRNMTKYESECTRVTQRYKPRLCMICTTVNRRKRNIETSRENTDIPCSYRIKTNSNRTLILQCSEKLIFTLI